MTFRRAGRLPDAGVLLICWFRGTGAARHRCHAPPHDRRHARQDTKRVCTKRPDNDTCSVVIAQGRRDSVPDAARRQCCRRRARPGTPARPAGQAPAADRPSCQCSPELWGPPRSAGCAHPAGRQCAAPPPPASTWSTCTSWLDAPEQHRASSSTAPPTGVDDRLTLGWAPGDCRS